MKLLKVGEKQIYCEKQDGTKKWFKATSTALSEAKAFKEGDSIKIEFNKETYIGEHVTKNQPGGSGGKYGGKSYSNNASYVCSDERSVYSAVTSMLADIKLADVKDIETTKKAIKELFVQGMELIKVKAVAKTEEKKEKAPDQEPGITETIVKDELEEPEE